MWLKSTVILFLTVSTLNANNSRLEANIEIAAIDNGVYNITANQLAIIKAFEWTFRDGAKVVELKIENYNNNYYLVAICLVQDHKRIAAVFLNQVGNTLLLDEEADMKVCSAVACKTCQFFFENNKIVACKCEETSTVSNHCHYKSATAFSFSQNFQRALKVLEQK